jgi:hypothetical protein
MSKPFEPEEARIAEEKTKELVSKLNRVLKRYVAELGPQKDHDMAFRCRSNPSIVIYVDVEAARGDRWRKVIADRSGRYKTVRWPIAKKNKCIEKYIKEKLIAILLTFNRDNVEEMVYIDCETWVREGQEETAPFVHTARRGYRYRKETPEKFWGIDKSRVIWGIQNLERFLDELLQRKGLKCL